MFRYLRAAFTARPRVPGLGGVPFNLLGLAGFGILGAANPAFWALGLGFEAAYLFGLASNRRFREVVDARSAPPPPPSREPGAGWEQLVAELGGGERARLMALNAKLQRILGLYERFHADDLTSGQNRESLLALLGHYARLLLARENLERHWTDDDDAGLRAEAAALEADLRDQGLTSELRASKTRTLEIVQARLENQKRRAQMGEEIDSELRRIEAQFDLALENAAMSSTPQAISSDLAIDLARFDAALAALPRTRGRGAAGAGRRARPPAGARVTAGAGDAAGRERGRAAGVGARGGDALRERRRLPVRAPRQRPRPRCWCRAPAGAAPGEPARVPPRRSCWRPSTWCSPTTSATASASSAAARRSRPGPPGSGSASCRGRRARPWRCSRTTCATPRTSPASASRPRGSRSCSRRRR